MRYAYPVDILEDADGVTVTFPDVPEAITFGATVADALDKAAEALVTGLSFYVDLDQPIPHPSATGHRLSVPVPSLEAAKIALTEAMRQGGVSNVALARQLDLDEKAIRRLRDLLHESKISQVETALRALGRHIEISVLQNA